LTGEPAQHEPARAGPDRPGPLSRLEQHLSQVREDTDVYLAPALDEAYEIKAALDAITRERADQSSEP
jgi:hypothetical protein